MKKTNIKISKELRDILHGYIMSDGYVSPRNFLTVDQGKKQYMFVQWLYENFQELRTSTPIRSVPRVHPETGKASVSYRFQTRAVLKGFRQMWYKQTLLSNNSNYKKVLPKTLNCFFSPTFLAVWFAGDGTKTIGSKGAKFEVTAFSHKEKQRLQKLFLNHYNIKTKLIKSGMSKSKKQQWALVIPADQYTKFKKIIVQTNLIPNMFSYKLHSK